MAGLAADPAADWTPGAVFRGRRLPVLDREPSPTVPASRPSRSSSRRRERRANIRAKIKQSVESAGVAAESAEPVKPPRPFPVPEVARRLTHPSSPVTPPASRSDRDHSLGARSLAVANPRARSASVSRPSSSSSLWVGPGHNRRPNWGWTHPGGVKLDSINWTDVLRGMVINTSSIGIFLDVGAERNAFLAVPARHWKFFRRGDIIEDLNVEELDVARGRFAVSTKQPERAIAENHLPLTSFFEGLLISTAVVVDYGVCGTFVNIGASKDALLVAPRSIANRCFRGQVLRNMVVVRVDNERRVLSCRWKSIYQAVRQIEHPEIVSAHLLPERTIRPPRTPALWPHPTRNRTPAPGAVGAVGAAVERSPSVRTVDSARTVDTQSSARRTDFAQTSAARRTAAARRRSRKKLHEDKVIAQHQEEVDQIHLRQQQLRQLHNGREERSGEASPPRRLLPKAYPIHQLEARGTPRSPPYPPDEDDILPGDYVDGEVTGTTADGVQVRIGTNVRGLLKVSLDLLKEFQRGDCVQGMKAEAIDFSAGLVILSMEDPELEYEEPQPTPGRAIRGQ